MNTDTLQTRHDVSVEALAALGGPNLVYIRTVEPRELQGVLPAELAETKGKFYAVHAADGTRVAVLTDREAAFIAARQNDMEPVSVH